MNGRKGLAKRDYRMVSMLLTTRIPLVFCSRAKQPIKIETVRKNRRDVEDLADRFRERADLCEQGAFDPKGYPAWMLAERREPAANQYRAHADALEIASRRAVQ